MTSDPFSMTLRIPSDTPADVRVRVALALAEASIDRGLANQWRRFEQSLVDNECPADQLADILLWSYEHLQEERARLVEEVRATLVAEYGAAAVVAAVGSPAADTETVH
jgi:hypothetical protein